MVEDESGQFERANDAEEFLISQLRSLGQEFDFAQPPNSR
jgi:hypothetical protein